MPELDATAASCLAGGGNMGALMRAMDWSSNPLGPVEAWPQSLRTAVSIMLASGFPMLVLWGEDYIQLYNDAYRPVLGATKHPAALGQRAHDCWPEIWEDVLGPMFGRVMAGGEPIWNDDLLFVLDRNGYLEETFFTFSYSAIRGETGRPGGILVTCVETTARVLSERRLRTLRELGAQALSSQTVEQTCRTSAQTLAANPHDVPFALIYLVDEAGARLCASSVLVPGTAALPDAWPLTQVLETGRPQLVADLRSRGWQLPGGPWPEPADAALVLPIVHAAQARPIGALVAGISPRRELDGDYRGFLELVAGQIATAVNAARAYEAERERAEALAAIDRAKTAFFSNVSHEFRTPLTLLLGPIDAALAAPEQVLTGGELAAVRRNAVRLLKLVNTLLDFSRIEAGRLQASYQEVDLASLTTDMAGSFRSLIESAGLRFDIDCAAIDATVYVDAEMWEKIVLNLLSNAFKFTFDGGISVTLRERDGTVALVVRDTGIGIPDDELPHVFERFHRVRGARARTYEGTGIGLALVNELVRLHGGTISVDSRAGQGTSFTVVMPTGCAHLPPDRVNVPRADAATPLGVSAFVDEARQWLPQPEGDMAIEPDRGAQILVVDDNADMRDYLRRLLGPRWTVECAVDGHAALAAIHRSKPDLVISDVMMGGIDGFELVKQLRSDPATAAVPIILVSARAGEEARVEGLIAGADDYLVKPFSARELVARVRTQLELSHLRAEAATQFERLRSVFQVAPAAIAILRGRDHVIELANEQCLKLIGNRDVVGKPARVAVPELSAETLVLADRVFAEGERYVGREYAVQLDRRGDGTLETVYFDFVLQPLRGRTGAVDSIFLHAVDVTAQVIARREADAARRSAEQANRAKDEFLAMLGHELRNPLAPIVTALQLMNLRGDASAAKERAVIDRQVRHLVRLVDDLLDVSRIARGKIELRKEQIEIADVVARAIEMASPLLEERQHNLSVEVPRTGLVVAGDLTRLAQVVMNLLTNAAKYTEARGRVDVRAHRDGDEVELSVRDTGIGISPDMLPKVFDLFAQEAQSFDRSRGGLGLGLSIVRSLVGLHGGTVEARSEGVGRGSTFVIRLPAVAIVAEEEERQPSSARRRIVAARSLRVLVVDDNADAAQMIAEALEATGHTTRVAGDAPAAIHVAGQFKPDVALIDLGLPVMDGYELAERLRSAQTPPPALVAITGYGQDSDRRRSLAAGFFAHLVKPVDLPRLMRVLDRIARATVAQPSA